MSLYEEKILANYYALYISVLKNCFPEKALRYIHGEINDIRKRYPEDITNEDVKDMIAFKNIHKMTYVEIGTIYGLTGSGVYRRIERYRKKNSMKEIGDGREDSCSNRNSDGYRCLWNTEQCANY